MQRKFQYCNVSTSTGQFRTVANKIQVGICITRSPADCQKGISVLKTHVISWITKKTFLKIEMPLQKYDRGETKVLGFIFV